MFLAVLAYEWKKFFTYRIYYLSDLIGFFIFPLIINFFLWSSIIDSNSVGYDLPGIMKYLIISNAFSLFTLIPAEESIAHDIRTYRLGHKLLMPISYFGKILHEHLALSLIKFMTIFLPVLLFVQILLPIPWSPRNLLPIFCAVILALTLNAALSFIIGLLGFWFTEIWGISAIKNLTIGVLSGTVFPLDILPIKVQSAFLLTPFPYVSYVPTKLLLDPKFTSNESLPLLFIGAFWALVFVATVCLLWHSGLKRYCVNGA